MFLFLWSGGFVNSVLMVSCGMVVWCGMCGVVWCGFVNSVLMVWYGRVVWCGLVLLIFIVVAIFVMELFLLVC